VTLVKIATGSRIPPPEDPLRISFWGHISAPGEDIFTNLGEYVGNELPQGRNGPNTIFSKIQFGRRRPVPHIHHTGGQFWRHLISPHLLFFKNSWQNATVYKVHTHTDTIKCYDDKSAVIKRSSLTCRFNKMVCWQMYHQLDRIISRYKQWHRVTTIEDIFFLVLILTATHSLDLSYLQFLSNVPSTHNKTACVDRMAAYGTVPFSVIILCRMQAICVI